MNRSATETSAPLVSIITPTLNRAELLEWTLRSVRNQSYPNIEHIVIDGASVDGTVDLLQRYAPTYRMTWKSEPDSGMYSAINRGFELAHGHVLAYLNSDDLYFPWTVELVVDAFARRPDADFVFGDALAIASDTGRQSPYWVLPFDLDYIRRSGFLAQPAVFWRRRVLEEEGAFDETLRYVADCDYWMRAGERRHFVKVNEFLAIERNHGSTLRQAVGAPLWIELENVRARYVSLNGWKHEARARLHLVRKAFWTRVYSLALLAQSIVPAQMRRGPWSRVLNAGHTEVSRRRFLLRAIPFATRIPAIRRSVDAQLLRPSRYWLEPPT